MGIEDLYEGRWNINWCLNSEIISLFIICLFFKWAVVDIILSVCRVFEEIMFYMIIFDVYIYNSICSFWYGGLYLWDWDYYMRILVINVEKF